MAFSTGLLEKLQRLYSELAAFLPAYEAALERRESELERRTGIMRHWGFRSEDESRRHMAAMKIVDEETGFCGLSNKLEEMNARLDPVVAIIKATPALDLADLALKANAVACVYDHLWQSSPDQLDYGDELVRNLIENLCSIAGVPLAVSQHIAPRKDLN